MRWARDAREGRCVALRQRSGGGRTTSNVLHYERVDRHTALAVVLAASATSASTAAAAAMPVWDGVAEILVLRDGGGVHGLLAWRDDGPALLPVAVLALALGLLDERRGNAASDCPGAGPDADIVIVRWWIGVVEIQAAVVGGTRLRGRAAQIFVGSVRRKRLMWYQTLERRWDLAVRFGTARWSGARMRQGSVRMCKPEHVEKCVCVCGLECDGEGGAADCEFDEVALR
ncbi:hypothetical protein L1887_40467 [Cichorium endivia]|nr:hypothetical protein L1887_40467 [Cichorium endivia]